MFTVVLNYPHWLCFDNFWLPAGTDWKDLENKINFPSARQFLYVIPFTVIIFLVRHVIKTTITIPLGKHLGLKDKSEWKNHNHTFEEAFKNHGEKLIKDHEKLKELAKYEGVEVRKVERWMRKRIQFQRPSVLSKFGETLWAFFWYTGASACGFYILWDKPWFWDIQECWADYPNQNLPDSIKWYYMASLSFTLSQLIIQFNNAEKKKDHWQYMVHHIATLGLLSLSYVSNLTRIGSLVLILHDFLDVFLNLGQSAFRTKYKLVSNFCFVLFTLAWILTRLTIFPFLIYSTIYRTKGDFNIFPVYAILHSMLIVLQFLHLIWTYYIYKVIAGIMAKGVITDSRSCSDNSE